MNRLNRDRKLYPQDNFIALKILQYTGLQENLKTSQEVAKLAKEAVDKIEEQQTAEALKKTSYKTIRRATEPAWEAAWNHSNKKLRSYWAYENWIWRIQMSLETALARKYYSPASEQKVLESRRVRRKIQNDPWGTAAL